MGWNNAAWDTNTDTPAEVTALITANDGTTPVDVGGWLTLNGQIVANYPTTSTTPRASPASVSKESRRSISPPWPGMTWLMSLMPRRSG